MKNNLELAEQRIRSYYHIDGLWEILSGIILALLGFVYASRSFFQQNAWLPFSVSNLKDTTLILGLALGLTVITWLKQNITYQRTGYVEYKRENFVVRLQKNWKILALVSGALFLLIILVLIFPWARAGLFYGMTWLPALIGISFSLLLFNQARQTGLGRFQLLGWLGILLSAVLAGLALNHNLAHMLPTGLFASPIIEAMPTEVAAAAQLNADFAYWQVAILCGGLGLMLLTSGIFVLARYLQVNPASEAQHDQ